MAKHESDRAREHDRALNELRETHRAAIDALTKDHREQSARAAAEHKATTTALQTRFDASDKQNRELSSANIGLEADVRQLQQKLSRTESDYQHINTEFDLARTRIKELESRCSQFDSSERKDSAEMAALKERVSSQQKWHATMQDNINATTKRAENAEIALKAQKKLAEEKTAAAEDGVRKLGMAHAVMDELKQKHDQIKKERDDLMAATLEMRKKHDLAIEKYHQKKSDIAILRSTVKTHLERVKTLETELARSRDQMEENKKTIKQLQTSTFDFSVLFSVIVCSVLTRPFVCCVMMMVVC